MMKIFAMEIGSRFVPLDSKYCLAVMHLRNAFTKRRT